MILRKVSAAFLMRDGFTGRTLTGASGTSCLLDGRPLKRPVWKKDGYLVLTDIEPGEHELLVKRCGYRDESVPLSVKEEAVLEDTISLKPGAGYRFPPDTVRVTLSLNGGIGSASGIRIWLGTQPRIKLVLAQERAEAGDKAARLFCGGSPSQLPIPGHFLLADKSSPELVYLRLIREENGEFSEPLRAAHPRGTELVPMQQYGADGEGKVQILLSEPGTLVGFFGGSVKSFSLKPGTQTIIWGSEE